MTGRPGPGGRPRVFPRGDPLGRTRRARPLARGQELDAVPAAVQGGHDVGMLASFTPSGAHSTSMQLVAEAQADCAAIDANVFRIAPSHIRRRLRVLETLGPYPAQPVVVRADLPEDRRIILRDTLLSLHTHDPDLLARHHIRRFAAVDEDHYRPLASQIADAEALLSRVYYN